MSILKKNFAYNTILTLANYIFPILVFPYVSRVLGVGNIGICSFVDSLIDFFLIFASLGISVVGVREIARTKALNNRDMLSQTFSSLFIFNSIATAVIIFLLIVAAYTVPQLIVYQKMLFIGAGKIISTLFLIEWLFKGTEDFKYITYRTIVVKTFYVASVFIFVKEEGDYVIFFSLSTVMVFTNAIINWIAKRKHVNFKFSFLSLKKYSNGMLSLGLYLLLTSMYTTFNILYLGIVSTETEVGYYATAVKLYGIILALFTAFTTVMLPRISVLVEEKNFQEMALLIKKSFNLLLSLSIPLVVFLMLMAPWLVSIIAGSGYEGAVKPMRIVMPLVLIIGIAQILVIQILMPIKADRAILVNSIFGAALSVVFNIAIVGKLGSVGSAISLLTSESVVTICAAYFVYKKTTINIPVKLIFKHIVVAGPYILFFVVSSYYCQTQFCQILVFSLSFLLYFGFSQIFILKNELLISLLQKMYKHVN